MVACTRCGVTLGPPGDGGPAWSICGSIMGDEYTESYFLCPRCDVYTVEVVHDRFCGEETASARGPVPRGDGDARLGTIRRCATPWDKKCRCAAHLDYFGSNLD